MSRCQNCQEASNAEQHALGVAASLARENERLRAALEPFTKLGGPNDGVMPAYHDLEDDVVILENSGECITAGDVRAARNALGILHAPWSGHQQCPPATESK